VANEQGKRYVCAKCGAEMLVTKAGDGSLACCGEPMQLRGAPARPGQAGGK
jgi:desulfoferrodoxin-like iron-binding protein